MMTEVLRMQAVPLSAEPEGEHRDAWEPAAAALLVHHDAPPDIDQEELLRCGTPAPARAQELYADMGDAS